MTVAASRRLRAPDAKVQGASVLLLIGVLWLGLTLAFEFSFGRNIQHKWWAELLDAYAFKDGNIWPVVLVVTLLAPSLAARFTQRARP